MKPPEHLPQNSRPRRPILPSLPEVEEAAATKTSPPDDRPASGMQPKPGLSQSVLPQAVETDQIGQQLPGVRTSRSTMKALAACGLPRLAYSVKEVAALLGVSEKTVRRLISRGLLGTSRALRHHRIPRKEIEKFLERTMAS